MAISRHSLKIGQALVPRQKHITVTRLEPGKGQEASAAAGATGGAATGPLPYLNKPRKKSMADDAEMQKLRQQKYRRMSRRWTGIMVGLPVAIVSGYTLYLREVFGVPQRSLMDPEDGKDAPASKPKDNKLKPKMF